LKEKEREGEKKIQLNYYGRGKEEEEKLREEQMLHTFNS